MNSACEQARSARGRYRSRALAPARAFTKGAVRCGLRVPSAPTRSWSRTSTDCYRADTSRWRRAGYKFAPRRVCSGPISCGTSKPRRRRRWPTAMRPRLTSRSTFGSFSASCRVRGQRVQHSCRQASAGAGTEPIKPLRAGSFSWPFRCPHSIRAGLLGPSDAHTASGPVCLALQMPTQHPGRFAWPFRCPHNIRRSFCLRLRVPTRTRRSLACAFGGRPAPGALLLAPSGADPHPALSCLRLRVPTRTRRFLACAFGCRPAPGALCLRLRVPTRIRRRHPGRIDMDQSVGLAGTDCCQNSPEGTQWRRCRARRPIRSCV